MTIVTTTHDNSMTTLSYSQIHAIPATSTIPSLYLYSVAMSSPPLISCSPHPIAISNCESSPNQLPSYHCSTIKSTIPILSVPIQCPSKQSTI